jgi:ABC-type dipeptide/oligopeptide/nickel transport system permease component/ABC-type transport system substrate-binding protein
MRRGLRALFWLVVVALGCTAGLWLVGLFLRPDLSDQPLPETRAEIDAAVTARKVHFDPERTPDFYVHEHVAPQHESQIFSDLVKQGELPPLIERMPRDPVVIQGREGIGKYGGTWMRLATGSADVETINFRLSAPFLMHWSPLGYPIEPHIAESVESSPDKRAWTITLREGLKWSDGVPYTADDIMYWWNCEVNNKNVSQPPSAWAFILGGKQATFEKLDQYRVRITFPEPNIIFPEQLCQIRELCDTPEHYLRRYHPDPSIGDPKFIKKELAGYKLASPLQLYRFVKDTKNPEHPRLWPWIYRTYMATTPQVFVRNPYYFAVDTAGNQLPYIDRVQFEFVDKKILPISAANGGATMQDRGLRFADYTELMSRQKQSGTRVLHWYPATRSDWVINPNLNRREMPGQPDTKLKAQLLADKRFRQALSLAIDRKQIIHADYSDVGEPSQVAPGPESRFHHERVAKAFTENDPARANALLDELGLARRDSEGYRTFPDGSRMTFYLDFTSDFTGPGPGQFVVDDWQSVGVRAILRDRTRLLFYAEKDSLDWDLLVWTGESDFMPTLSPRYFIPRDGESFYAVQWGRWYQRGGFYGNPIANALGCAPVPKDSPMYHAVELYEAALRAPDVATQKMLMDRILDIAADNTWSISTTTAPPQPVVIDADLHNVPEIALYGVVYSTPGNAGIETWFFGHPRVSAGTIAETEDSLIHPTPRPGSRSTPENHGYNIGWLLLLAFILFVAMLGVRHPFVGRRLLIMIPSMLVISIAVFTIIQLPPGDFVTTHFMQLSESGDPSDITRAEDLRKQFHFDEPHWKQYARWMGFYWFTTFNPADTGLLQGNLGRSMENSELINNLVEDRITLTIAISLGTILLTWLLALPIGIYSAVKQYSISDHALTLIGFVGMCVPSFLLALILTAKTGFSGLFSPEFAAQAEWNWPKLIDLLKHIWIPVLILGVGGTASMIRIMRANLLDELRKPYVITAMAKGVRPTKLLLKYPVRLAINPFVSGIGGLFPQLISGGAIVSIVMSLQTVGPMLFTALFTEDTYLAGSMLIVLSLLGIIGTLVSDLLLLWLDPRIRFEGGTR